MKKYIIILLILISIIFDSRAQYAIVENKVVLPELALDDESFRNQLDTILFVKHSCFRDAETKKKRKYAFFTKIEETESGLYIISIIYSKPTLVEDDVNTGVYTLKDFIFVIREEKVKHPLFKATEKNFVFKYEKELMKRNNKKDSYYYDEYMHPEEFCSWRLSYFKGQIKILNLENVNIPYEKPKMLDKIEPIRYHQ